jgi:hypothetical protein
MVFNFSQLIKISGTETHPAAETQSIGLPAYAQLAQVFAEPSVSFTVTPNSVPSTGISPSTGIIPSASFTVTQNSQPRAGIIPSGSFVWTTKLSAIYRDFIWTKNFQPFTGILQKLMPARAAVGNSIKPPGR